MSPGVPALRTTVERSGSVVTVSVHGELDLATAPAVRRALARAASYQPATLVVDLAGLEFVDATGVSALVDAADRVRAAGGALCLASPPRMLRRVLALLELDGRLPVVRS